MKWLLTTSLSLILVLGGCSASASNTANAQMISNNDATKISTTLKLKKGSLFSNPRYLTMLEKYALERITAHKHSLRMNKMIAYLKTRVHKTPYVFSGLSSRYGWDCSGMVRWFYEQSFGITLEHSATAQAHAGHRVSKANAKVGDIVIFGWKGYSGFYHSSLYLGNNQVINANRGSGTTIIEPLSDYKGSRIVFVRVVNTQ